MASIVKLTLGLLIAIFVVVVITYVIEAAFIGMVMSSFVNYIQASSLSAGVKTDLTGRIYFIKFAWRAFTLSLAGIAFIWYLANIYKNEAEQYYV